MEATQESTQPCTDPRRMGYTNSGLQEEDLSDVICILHPNSYAAHDAVAATAAVSPQHILQRDELEHQNPDSPVLDIALRLSSKVKDPTLGFCFGRNRPRCDILLSPDDNAKRISNLHFKVFLTPDAILMLEDTSTNGSLVDNYRLRKGQDDSSRMLTNGSVIQVVNGSNPPDELRFIVRIPSREGLTMQYSKNMYQFLERVQKHQNQTGAAHLGNRQGSGPPVLPWAVANTYGMHWTGGTKYNVTGQIGKGAFATVYKLATKQQGAVYAAKELDKRRFMKNGILDQKVDNEMKIMRDLRHPNIVQYIDHHEHDRWIYIIMEYVPYGELSTFLQNGQEVPEPALQQVTRQVLHALQYLHKRKITHRDIKPDNILIASFEPLRVKLSDFGLSKVVQEESFLKTFCGTLLYCAPEVYPEYKTYRRGEVRKRRRFGDPYVSDDQSYVLFKKALLTFHRPPKTSPYDQSVDTWSFGAVLYHIMAGTPPYMGSAENRGAQMLQTIMTTEPDYGSLHAKGITGAGINFVSQLLNRDPQRRPKERESFQHPWIVDVADVDEYEDDDVHSDYGDALSDIGEDAEEELDASQISIHDEAEEQDSVERDELAQSKRPRIGPPDDVHYPSLPTMSGFKNAQPDPETTPRRLFGEITPAALQSSHALGASIEAYDGDDFSVRDFLSSAGESMISDGNSLNSIISLPEFPFGGSSPSLMGAENLVRQLNMNSSHPVTPYLRPLGVETPAKQGSLADRNETPAGGNVPAMEQANSNDATPKASKFNRRIHIPIPDTASESSSNHSRQGSCKDGCDDTDAPAAAAGEGVDSELATTLDAKTGKEIADPLRDGGQAQAQAQARTDNVPGPELGTMGIPKAVPTSQLRKPQPLLGKLTSLPGSIFDLTIRLENRMTSWGRGPQATICHPDPMDTRIPAYALEVTFWAPAIESRIAAGDDWTTIPGVMAILSTKTRKCIWVNDTELRRGEDSGREGLQQFGKLYSGDIITIFKHRSKFLKLQCEFYHGESAGPRPEQEKGFVVRRVLKSKEDSTAANRMPIPKNNALDKK